MPSANFHIVKMIVRLNSFLLLGGYSPVKYQRFLFSGSSPRSVGSRPESSPYLQEEVLLISIPIGHPLYDLDLVVDSLEHAGMNG